MDKALLNQWKEMSRKVGTFVVYCLCLALFSYGVGRAVFAVLTLDSRQPSTHLGSMDLSEERSSASAELLGLDSGETRMTSDGLTGLRPVEATRLQTAEDFVRHADSLGVVLPVLDTIRTMGLRDPFSLPVHLLDLPSEVSRTGATSSGEPASGLFARGEQEQPAGLARHTEPESFPKGGLAAQTIASQRALIAELVSRKLDLGSQWIASMVANSGVELMSADKLVSRGVAPALSGVAGVCRSSDSVRIDAVGQLFPKAAASTTALRTRDLEESLNHLTVDSYIGVRSRPDSVALFPWLRSAGVVSSPRRSLEVVAPAVAQDAVMSALHEETGPRSVASVPLLPTHGGGEKDGDGEIYSAMLPYEMVDGSRDASSDVASSVQGRLHSSFVISPLSGKDRDGESQSSPIAIPVSRISEIAEPPVSTGGSWLTASQSMIAPPLTEDAGDMALHARDAGPDQGIVGSQAPSNQNTSTPVVSESSASVNTDEPLAARESAVVVIDRRRAVTVADSPSSLESDFQGVDEPVHIAWPSIDVTGVVVASDGRTSATIRLGSQRRIVQPGDQLDGFEIVSIGLDCIELRLGDEVRQYGIGDGLVD